MTSPSQAEPLVIDSEIEEFEPIAAVAIRGTLDTGDLMTFIGLFAVYSLFSEA